MNAHKFVAEKGVDEAKRVLIGAPESGQPLYFNTVNSVYFFTGYRNRYFVDESWGSEDEHSSMRDCDIRAVSLTQLKRVVESLDVVTKHGGLFCLKCQIEKGGYDFEWYGENREFGFTELNVLEKAIADYELVESYKDGEND